MITLHENGFSFDRELLAGERVPVRLDPGYTLPETARLRLILTDAEPLDAHHSLASSTELTQTVRDGSLTLLTEPLLEVFRGRRITDFRTVRLEAIESHSGEVLAATTLRLGSSRLLWGGDVTLPAGRLSLTHADLDSATDAWQGKLDTATAAWQEDLATEREARAAGDGAQADALAAHAKSADNPHAVTAAQVGALPLTGGHVSGQLEADRLCANDFDTPRMHAGSIGTSENPCGPLYTGSATAMELYANTFISTDYIIPRESWGVSFFDSYASIVLGNRVPSFFKIPEISLLAADVATGYDTIWSGISPEEQDAFVKEYGDIRGDVTWNPSTNSITEKGSYLPFPLTGILIRMAAKIKALEAALAAKQ